MAKTTYLLTGDIGGTNSRMSLYDTTCGATAPLVVKFYRNATSFPPGSHSDPDAFSKYVIIPFLQYCWEDPETLASVKLVPLRNVQILACLATAGLVVDNKVQMTNLNNLVVDGAAMTANTQDPYLKHLIQCTLINDFVAQGYGCLTLEPKDVKVLYGPATEDDVVCLPRGPKVCVGAGTGLGECYLTPNTSFSGETSPTFSCYSSEGGHVEYAPRNALEVELFTFLSNKFTSKHRISVERVVSGMGLANVYDFLSHKFPKRIDPLVHAEFLQANDEQGRVVAVNTTEGSLCRQAMSIMMSAYGCEVGSAAIKWLPLGGLFVTGGLTPKNMKFIEGLESDFMMSYLNKGRVSPILERIPIYAVLTEDLGVRGVHKAAMMEYERFRGGGSTRAGAVVKFVKDNGLVLATLAAVSFAMGGFVNSRKSR